MNLLHLLVCCALFGKAPVMAFVPNIMRPLSSKSRFQKQRPHLIRESLTLSPNPPRWSTTTHRPPLPLHVVPSSIPLDTNPLIAWSSMGLLALQFGIMPTLQKKCVPSKLNRSSMLLAQECSKLALSSTCFFLLVPPSVRHSILMGWTIHQWWTMAAIPATLYAVQNYAKLVAYQHLPAVTYSVLNQTKTFLAALFCYILLGIPQSKLQMVALTLLLISALILESVIPLPKLSGGFSMPSAKAFGQGWGRRLLGRFGTRNTNMDGTAPSITNLFISTVPVLPSSEEVVETPEEKDVMPYQKDPYHFTRGVLPLLLANLTSGLAAALGQHALQHHRRNIFFYSMELSGASAILVALSFLVTKDGRTVRSEGWKRHWTRRTWIPIGAHAVGGLLVGIVTKYAGSVQKGFALIFGVLLSGLFQKVWLSQEPVTREQVVGGILACISLWMHSSFPPVKTL